MAKLTMAALKRFLVANRDRDFGCGDSRTCPIAAFLADAGAPAPYVEASTYAVDFVPVSTSVSAEYRAYLGPMAHKRPLPKWAQDLAGAVDSRPGYSIKGAVALSLLDDIEQRQAA